MDGPRIIIDSGSNSYYSIDPLILEKILRMPVINLSDNVGYPLDHKLHYLSRYSKQGDIIILPLEWGVYNHRFYQDNYILPVLDGSISYYYESLPNDKKLDFTLNHVPVNTFLNAFFRRLEQHIDSSFHTNNLQDYKSRLAQKNGNSLGSGLNPYRLEPHQRLPMNESCDQSLFGTFKISQQFLKDISILKDAMQSGVKVVITWPAVANNEENTCCKSTRVKDNLDRFVRDIKNTLEPHGFIIAGEPLDSVFSDKFIYDHYYHITESAAKVRSKRLGERLLESGLTPANTDYKPGDSISELYKKVDRLLERL